MFYNKKTFSNKFYSLIFTKLLTPEIGLFFARLLTCTLFPHMDRSNGISLYYVALRHPEREPVKTETPRLHWHTYKIQ